MTDARATTTAVEVLATKAADNGRATTVAVEVLAGKYADLGNATTVAIEVMATELNPGYVWTVALEVMSSVLAADTWREVYKTRRGVFGATGYRVDLVPTIDRT